MTTPGGVGAEVAPQTNVGCSQAEAASLWLNASASSGLLELHRVQGFERVCATGVQGGSGEAEAAHRCGAAQHYSFYRFGRAWRQAAGQEVYITLSGPLRVRGIAVRDASGRGVDAGLGSGGGAAGGAASGDVRFRLRGGVVSAALADDKGGVLGC